MKKIYAYILLLTCCSTTIMAGTPIKFEHKIVAGLNIGATAPVPIPAEVRSIDAYWPLFTPRLGYSVTYNNAQHPNWAIQSGIQMEIKGMGIRDKVKYMYTDVIMDGSNIKGYFVGRNQTEIKASYITVPLSIVYKPSPKWRVNAGAYLSYCTSSEFNGTVWDGYLREGEDIATSMKIYIKEKGEADFNFSDDMRDVDWGLVLGGEYQLNQKFGLYSNLNWGMTSIFPSSFKGIDFKMYNIYLSIGMTYNL